MARYIEGEVKEVKFNECTVWFSLEPSTEFKRKDGDREFALLIDSDNKNGSAKLVPVEEFYKVHFKCKYCALCSQLAAIKINRCKIRVVFPWNDEVKDIDDCIVILK